MKNIKKYIPKNADGKIESVLWEWDENKKGHDLVKFETIKKPKD